MIDAMAAAGKKKSRYMGVTWSKSKALWMAQIRHEEKVVFLGYFPATDLGERRAAITYDQAAVKYRGKMAELNFPEIRGALTAANET